MKLLYIYNKFNSSEKIDILSLAKSVSIEELEKDVMEAIKKNNKLNNI